MTFWKVINLGIDCWIFNKFTVFATAISILIMQCFIFWIIWTNLKEYKIFREGLKKWKWDFNDPQSMVIFPGYQMDFECFDTQYTELPFLIPNVQNISNLFFSSRVNAQPRKIWSKAVLSGKSWGHRRGQDFYLGIRARLAHLYKSTWRKARHAGSNRVNPW